MTHSILLSTTAPPKAALIVLQKGALYLGGASTASTHRNSYYVEKSSMANRVDEAALIPDWCAILTIIGAFFAATSFAALWVWPGAIPAAILTAGLVACAIGMHVAERALGVH